MDELTNARGSQLGDRIDDVNSGGNVTLKHDSATRENRRQEL